MRRWGDLDSNYSVASRPYCNGRATAFNKVLNGRLRVVCAVAEKTTPPAKASVVGFHRPDTGTAKINLVIVLVLDPVQLDHEQEQDHDYEITLFR